MILTVAVTLAAALYGALASLPVCRWIGAGGHRRYEDEWERPLPRVTLVPFVVALVAGLLAWRLAPAGLAVVTAHVLPLPAYAALWRVDLDCHRLPDLLTLPAYPATALLLAAASWLGDPWLGAAGGGSQDWTRAMTAGGLALLFFGVLHLVSRRGLGLGDVKLAGPLGATLGWWSWSLLITGVYAMFLVGGLAAAWLMVVRRTGRKARLAFGPAMIAGAGLAILANGTLH